MQKKVPFYIATFSTHETIEFAAQNGYGLMFSQGATLEECEAAQELYKKIAGVYPQVILMRVFSMASDPKVAYERAVVATDHFVKSMRAVQSKQEQPSFNKRNYDALLTQRHAFFDAQKFMNVALIGNEEEIVEQISNIQRRIHNLHLVLKVGASDNRIARVMLHTFMQKIKPKIKNKIKMTRVFQKISIFAIVALSCNPFNLALIDGWNETDMKIQKKEDM